MPVVVEIICVVANIHKNRSQFMRLFSLLLYKILYNNIQMDAFKVEDGHVLVPIVGSHRQKTWIL